MEEKTSYRLALLTEYDGTRYAGYQVQKNLPTVQAELEKNLSKVFQTEISVTGSGRTDSGVHALGQVIHADVPRLYPERNIQMAVNSNLPPDIRILNVSIVDDAFHARYNAVNREYEYHIIRRPTAVFRHQRWQVFQNLEVDAMQACAGSILGEWDFSSFCNIHAEVRHKRCIISHSSWTESSDKLVYTISANRFLHTMVRSLVGTMVDVGKGRYQPDDFIRILKAKDRRAGAVTAPPQGLFLKKVSYDPEISWAIPVLSNGETI